MTDDWFDMLGALTTATARFLVVGAHALAVYGVPRGTQDLDIWIDPSGANPDRVWKALLAFGASVKSLGVTRTDLARADTVIQIGLPPNRIDLLTSLSGLPAFAEAWTNREYCDIRGMSIPFIGRQDLIVNKRATGRARDLADLEDLGEAG